MKDSYSHSRSRLNRSSQGSLLIIAIIFSVIIGIIVATYLKMSMNELELSDDAFMSNALLNAAEAAAEEATWALNNNDWTDWTDFTTHMARQDGGIDMSNGKTATLSSIVWDYALIPTLYVEGKATLPDGRELIRQVEITLAYRSLFANGLTAKDTLLVTGAAATIDSYDSAAGLPGAGNKGDKGTLGSINFESDVTGVDIGNSDVFGYVSTGGSSIDFGNGTVTGEDTPAGVTIDPDRVSYDFDIDLPDVDTPTAGGSAKTDSDPQIVNIEQNNKTETLSGGTADSPIEYSLTDLDMGQNSELTINGHIRMIVSGDVDLSNVVINAGSTLTIYVGGDLGHNQGSNTINNANPESGSFAVYGTQSEADIAGGDARQEISIHGGAGMTAVVYAPNANLTISGNANFNGAAVANQITLNGGVQFHYDEGLADFYGSDPTFKIDTWTEIYDKTDRIDFSDMSALSTFTPPDFSTYTSTGTDTGTGI